MVVLNVFKRESLIRKLFVCEDAGREDKLVTGSVQM